MSDSSEHEDDLDDYDGNVNVDLTNFLFGNINENGELVENDVFDSESQKQLASLSKFGCGFKSLVKHMLKDDASRSENESIDAGSNLQSEVENGGDVANPIDYSDINELAEDVSLFLLIISKHFSAFAVGISKKILAVQSTHEIKNPYTLLK